MFLCVCKGVTKSEVEKLGLAGHVLAESLTDQLGFADDDCCGRCLDNIEEFVDLAGRARACTLALTA